MRIFKKILYILQFTIVLAPFTFLIDVIYYAVREGSLSKGIGYIFYASMLNSGGTGWPKMVSILCIIVSVISFCALRLFSKKEK